MHKLLPSVSAIVGLAIVLSGCGKSGGGDESIATVNGERISKDEYIAYLEHKVQVLVQTPQGPVNLQVAAPLNFQALNDIVSQKLLVQLAKQEGVLPTDTDVNNELQLRTSMRADFVRALTDQGFSLSDIKNELMIGLCRHKLLSKGVTITDAQVDEFIKSNPAKFMTPRYCDMSFIKVNSEAEKTKVDSELRTGQTFTVVAKQYSAIANPMYPQREYDKYSAQLKALADKMGENGTSEWVKEGTSFFKFHMEKNTPPTKIEIKDWMKIQIQRELADQKGAAAQDLDKKLMDLRKNATVVVTKAGLKEKFEQLSRQLKESDMKNSTGGAKTDSAAAAGNAPKAEAANN